MSLLNIFDIAGSALSTQSVRMNVTASNLANAESISSSIDETYRSRQPVFQTMYADSVNKDIAAGVRVAGIVESDAPLQQQYRPDHPQANEEGYIFLPNVNVMDEMANMMSASRTYQNNIEVINTSKRLIQDTLGMGQ